MSLHHKNLTPWSPRFHCLIQCDQQWTRLSIKSPGSWDASRNAGSHEYWIVYLLGLFFKCASSLLPRTLERNHETCWWKKFWSLTISQSKNTPGVCFCSSHRWIPPRRTQMQEKKPKRLIDGLGVFCRRCDIFFYYPCLRGSSAANYPGSAST